MLFFNVRLEGRVHKGESLNISLTLTAHHTPHDDLMWRLLKHSFAPHFMDAETPLRPNNEPPGSLWGCSCPSLVNTAWKQMSLLWRCGRETVEPVERPWPGVGQAQRWERTWALNATLVSYCVEVSDVQGGPAQIAYIPSYLRRTVCACRCNICGCWCYFPGRLWKRKHFLLQLRSILCFTS